MACPGSQCHLSRLWSASFVVHKKLPKIPRLELQISTSQLFPCPGSRGKSGLYSPWGDEELLLAGGGAQKPTCGSRAGTFTFPAGWPKLLPFGFVTVPVSMRYPLPSRQERNLAGFPSEVLMSQGVGRRGGTSPHQEHLHDARKPRASQRVSGHPAYRPRSRPHYWCQIHMPSTFVTLCPCLNQLQTNSLFYLASS